MTARRSLRSDGDAIPVAWLRCGMLVAVRRAKQILLVVGVCLAAGGAMALPFPRGQKALTQSVFEGVATTGAFTRPGLVLICVGLACLALAAVLPSGRP